MANTINAIQCVTTLKNTGSCDCFFDPKLIVGKILIPKNRVLTQAEVDAIQATLEALVTAAKKDRIFPVQKLVAVTDGSEEPTFQTFGYGGTAPVREGKYIWTFQFTEGGVQLNNALRSFNGQSAKYAELYIESSNVLIGTLKKDADGNDGLAGIPQEGGYPYTFPWKVNDGTNVTSYRTQSVFQPAYVNENIAFVKIPTTTYMLSELSGLQDVILSVVEVDDDTATIKALTSCGSNLFTDEEFNAELAQVTAWVLKNADGDTLVASGVTQNADAEGWDIVFPATIEDGDTVSLAAPTVLEAAPINVSGYESDTVTITVGS
jgi:hypothetical protein